MDLRMQKHFWRKHFWVGVALAALTVNAAPAAAQYHSFTPVKGAVEVDLGVLDDLPIPSNQRPRAFKKLTPPPQTKDSGLGVFPEPLVAEPAPVLKAPDLKTPEPKRAPGISYPPAMPPATLADMPEDKLLEAARSTPMDLPPGAVHAPVEKMPDMPIPLTAAPEVLAPPAMPEKKPQRVLKPTDDVQADLPLLAKPDAAPRVPLLAKPDLGDMPAEAETTPSAPALAPPASYPSYMTKPGQVSAPAAVGRPSPKPVLTETPTAMPSHKPAFAAEPVPLPSPKSARVLKPDDTAPISLTAPAPEAPAAETPVAPAPVFEPSLADSPVNLADSPANNAAAAPEPAPAPAFEAAPAVPAVPAEPEIMATVPAASDLSLEFTGNGSDLSSQAEAQLKNIVKQMQQMGENRLQVRAYATGEDGSKSSARRISLSRALAVRSYLMDAGIKPTRVDVRALGTETDRSPLDRVDLIFAR